MNMLRKIAERLLPNRAFDQLRVFYGQYKGYQVYDDLGERRRLMRRVFTVLQFNGITGDYVEFGCWGGVTFSLAFEAIAATSAARPIARHLWAFDSFEGLPPTEGPQDSHPVWNPGALSMSLKDFRRTVESRGVRPSKYSTIPGFYEDTIGPAAKYDGTLPDDIAFAYVDCDLHSSTKTVLTFLKSRLKHGMIVAFDDYYCFSSTAVAGERLALLEFLAEDQQYHFSPYIQFGWFGMSFVVEDRQLLSGRVGKLA